MTSGRKFFNFLARVMGGLWILGGLGFLLSAFIQSENRAPYGILGTFLIVAGLGFMLVKPVTESSVSRFHEVAEKLIRKR